MQRRSFIQTFWVALAIGAARLLGLRPQAASAAPSATPTGDMMDGNMMGGNDMAEMMAPGNMAGPMRTGMELFMRHAQIRRTVTELPNGVHAATESDDPRTAALI